MATAARVHVFLSGASGGIGLATAKRLLAWTEPAYSVTLQCRTKSDAVDAIARESEGRAAVVRGDMSSEADVARMFAEAQSALGAISVLVVNHGIWETEDTPIKDLSLERWQRCIDVNLTGAFLAAREYMRQLEAHGAAHTVDLETASVVFITSTSAIYGEHLHAEYAAAKSGLHFGLMKSLKNEIVHVAPHGRVNCVAPGWVVTPMTEGALRNNPRSKIEALATVPTKRVALPDDVANAICFLASPTLARHVSGASLEVSGGFEGSVANSEADLESVVL
eukprot:Amastigsp_a1843_10.p2 type:complete len:280 gc:universal Amastigsp_a1843_10:850-11(-)